MHWRYTLFSFRGRIGPAQWRPFALVLVGLALGLETAFIAPVVAFLIDLPASLGLGDSLVYLVTAVAVSNLIACFPVVWPLCALCTKRLHDLDYSGWWLLPLLFYQKPIAWLWILAVLAVRDGVEGPNRYGPPPGGTTAKPSRCFPELPAVCENRCGVWTYVGLQPRSQERRLAIGVHAFLTRAFRPGEPPFWIDDRDAGVRPCHPG